MGASGIVSNTSIEGEIYYGTIHIAKESTKITKKKLIINS